MNVLSPSDLRGVFGKNLRELAASYKSISQLCRELGINRTQFNRYLNGETHPRPDVLDRICRHFGVDARILIEPLEALRRANGQSLMAALADDGIEDMPVPNDTEIPPGTFECWGYSVMWPGCVFRNMVSVGAGKDTRRTRTRVPNWVYRPGLRRNKKSFDVLRGMVVRQLDGLLLIERSEGSDVLFNYTFRKGYVHDSRIYPGICMIGAPPHPGIQYALIPVMLEHVEPGYRSVAAASRKPRLMPEPDAPHHVREILSELATVSHIQKGHVLWMPPEKAMPTGIARPKPLESV